MADTGTLVNEINTALQSIREKLAASTSISADVATVTTNLATADAVADAILVITAAL